MFKGLSSKMLWDFWMPQHRPRQDEKTSALTKTSNKVTIKFPFHGFLSFYDGRPLIRLPRFFQ